MCYFIYSAYNQPQQIDMVEVKHTLQNKMRLYVLLATCVLSVICTPTGDYCKAPFQRIGNGCYFISNEKVTGDAAAYVLCADRGAYLANFETLEEAMRMKYELLVRKTGLLYYIGGRKMNRNIAGGDWKWFKNGERSNITYFLFPKSQPNGSSRDPQDCLSFWSPEYNFNDIHCDHSNLYGGYICEK